MNNKESKNFSLRSIDMDDAAILYKWQSHPTTRKYFRNNDQFSYESHVDWLSRKLTDKHCVLKLICINNIPAGTVRLDCLDENKKLWEISILVSPEHYQQGMGKAGLKLARKEFPDLNLKAEVKKDNVASIKLFESCDYIFFEGYYYSYAISQNA